MKLKLNALTIITASIVLYENDSLVLKRAIESILMERRDLILFLIDNSLKDSLRGNFINEKIKYIHNPTNPGFGAAHNIAIQKAIEIGSKYHFIINPDIHFNGDIMTPMVKYMQQYSNIGMMMPQILNEDGTVQNLPKLLPKPLDILCRKVKKPKIFYNNFIDNYELRFVPKNIIYNTPVLSGCFTLLNLEAIKEVGMYDDRFFMYFEDWDLSRRMHQKYQTIYFPSVSVYHGYESGANKNSKLFKIFIHSAVAYFNKWGWFFDTERNEINKKALAQFGKD